MNRTNLFVIGEALMLPTHSESVSQREIADLKNKVVTEFVRWLRADSQVPPRRIISHSTGQALVEGKSTTFAEVEKYAATNSIWLQARYEAQYKNLSQPQMLQLLIEKLTEQSALLERLRDAADEQTLEQS